MKKINILISFLIVFLIVIISYWIFVNILFPAHLSYKEACFPEEFKIKYPQYEVVGQVTVNYTETGERQIIKEIFVEDKDESFIKINRHECVHINQALTNRIYSCRTPLKVINEIEAYTFEKLPEFLFNIIYGKNC